MAGADVDVPPRVIPLFIHEIVTSPPGARDLHLRHFKKHLPRVLKARVVDEDIADLFVALCSVCRYSKSFEPLPNGGMVAYSALQVLLEMVNVRLEHSVQCLRVIKKLFDRLSRKRSDALALQRPALEGLATRAAAGAHAADSTTHSVTSNNDVSSIDASATVKSQQHHNHTWSAVSDAPFVRSADAPNAHEALQIEVLLEHHVTRCGAYDLYTILDRSACDLTFLTSAPEKLHLHFPSRLTSNVKVYRDFVMCTQRPKLTRQWGPVASVHIKTNIAKKSEIMYRILVEGYNYGVNAPIFADVVGYTNRNWDELGKMSKYGWPEEWDATSTNEYAPGATIAQYFSTDDFVVVRLQAKSMFSVGFSVSAWLCFHGMGNGFPITATIHHQDADL